MKKALVYASVASMIQQFNMKNIELLIKLGYQVDVACNFEFGSTMSKEKTEQLKKTLQEKLVTFYHIPVPRRMGDIRNLRKSYDQTLQLMNEEKYELIHCHSPIGGIICRWANKNCLNYKQTRMIYTAHGFHFFKGNSPFKNFLFRNIERWAARYTDTLITINTEDYEAAKKFKLKENGSVIFLPGVGVDIHKFSNANFNRIEILKKYKIPDKKFIVLSIGELNENKNHQLVIKALSQIPHDNIHYVVVGNGKLETKLVNLAIELGLDNRVHLVGFVNDVNELLSIGNLYIHPSFREGLSVALMEALISNIPVIASDIRGNRDLIRTADDLFNPYSYHECKNCISTYLNSPEQSNLKVIDRHKYIEKFSSEQIMEKMESVYIEIIK